MKKKPAKKEPLIFTPEIRAHFRERELKRIERYRKEIVSLRESNANLLQENKFVSTQLERIKKEFYKFYKEVFS